MTIDVPQVPSAWAGHPRGSAEYRRLLAALFCAGVATFAQLYSPQAVLPLIAADLHIGAANAALMVSAATAGLAIGVIPWSLIADRIGRVRAMSLSVTAATVLGLLVPFAPNLGLLLAGRFMEGLLVGGVPAIAIAYLSEEIHRDHAARGGDVRRGHQRRWPARAARRGPDREVTGWRIGVLSVAVLCGVGALGFVQAAPRSRGYDPSRGRSHPTAACCTAWPPTCGPHASWRSSLRPSSSWVGSSRCTTSWASA